MRRSLKVKLSLIGAVLAAGAMADDIKANKGKADASFVEDAFVGGEAEVRLSQLALRQSSDPAVKQLAQQMVDDHTKANDALRQVAESKGFTLPPSMIGSIGSTGSTGSMGSSTDDQGTVTGERMGAGDNRMGSGSMGSTGSIGDTNGSDSVGSGDTAGSGSRGAGQAGSGLSGTGSSGSGSTGSRGSSGSTGSTGSVGGSGAMGSGSMGSSSSGSTGSSIGSMAGMTSTQRQLMKKYDEISKKTGADFDKAYLTQLIDDHKKDVRLYERESKSGADKELKTWATNTLPTLRHHLEMVQTIDKDIRGRRTNTM